MLGRRRTWLQGFAATVCALGLSSACTSGPEPRSLVQTDDPDVPAPPPGLDTEGAAAWTTWQRLGVDDYRYRLTVGCFCLGVDGPVEVSGGEVTRVEGKRYDGESLTGFPDGDPTVDEVFRQLSRALRHADQVEVTYDPRTGVPKTIEVDWMTNAIDDEISYRVTDLEPTDEQ